MLNAKNDFIGAKGLELFRGREREEKENNTLEQMIKELKEFTTKYEEDNKLFYKKVDEQLAEIKGLIKYTLTEQEKQRFQSMSMSELILEMKNNINDMSSKMDMLIERVEDK
ncbi:hypothetical protein KQI38_03380 [Tissierella carlieri]|uniref:hypothetical protein n=1 Tax=Tissierella carlieri TaxID=689904 RepID=UPI001C11920F|nr:hypothetical protein [Tissierella carlieri]MBU5311055.1 hypothetical protein [Tissierella carlieri]